MKKFAAFLLTLLMVISLAACAGDNESAETSASDVGSSASDLEQLTNGAIWLEGRRLNGSDSLDTVMEWVNSLGLDLGE